MLLINLTAPVLASIFFFLSVEAMPRQASSQPILRRRSALPTTTPTTKKFGVVSGPGSVLLSKRMTGLEAQIAIAAASAAKASADVDASAAGASANRAWANSITTGNRVTSTNANAVAVARSYYLAQIRVQVLTKQGASRATIAAAQSAAAALAVVNRTAKAALASAQTAQNSADTIYANAKSANANAISRASDAQASLVAANNAAPAAIAQASRISVAAISRSSVASVASTSRAAAASASARATLVNSACESNTDCIAPAGSLPPNGTPQCNPVTRRCQIGCFSGYILTNGVCIPAATSCGPNACAPVDNGSVTCSGNNVCTTVCNYAAGFTLDSTGKLCVPTVGNTAFIQSDPATTVPYVPATITSTSTTSVASPRTTAGNVITSIQNTRCTTDASCSGFSGSLPANGAATCNPTTGLCQIGCRSGYIYNQGTCVASATTCGPNACPAVANGSSTCSGNNVCTVQCNYIEGYTLNSSGTACVNIRSDSSNCGTSGNVCPSSYNGSGTAACSGGACTLTCPSGQSLRSTSGGANFCS